MTLLIFLLAFLALGLLAAASVIWGADTRDLRDHPWEPLGS